LHLQPCIHHRHIGKCSHKAGSWRTGRLVACRHCAPWVQECPHQRWFVAVQVAIVRESGSGDAEDYAAAGYDGPAGGACGVRVKQAPDDAGDCLRAHSTGGLSQAAGGDEVLRFWGHDMQAGPQRAAGHPRLLVYKYRAAICCLVAGEGAVGQGHLVAPGERVTGRHGQAVTGQDNRSAVGRCMRGAATQTGQAGA